MQVLIVLTICGLIIGSSNQQTYSQTLLSTDETSSKSLTLARRSNRMNSVSDVRNIVDRIPEHKKNVLLRHRRDQSSLVGESERSSVVRAKPAICMPELRTVSLITGQHDDSIVYNPSCTRVKRCGGCCIHPYFICEPLISETRNFEVSILLLRANKTIRQEYTQIVAIEEHTSCRCICEKKAQHCTEKQQYVEKDCLCRCIDRDEEAKCDEKYEIKSWDHDTCSCQCREVEICFEGLEFDTNTCRCQIINAMSFPSRK